MKSHNTNDCADYKESPKLQHCCKYGIWLFKSARSDLIEQATSNAKNCIAYIVYNFETVHLAWNSYFATNLFKNF